MHLALAAVSWDPQIRGAVIVLTGVLILMGSVYLLLATNLGAKVGFLVALAGLTGWLVLLNILWLIGGGLGSIGYKGVAPGWVTKEIVVGDVAQNSTLKALAGTPGQPSTAFPNGWTLLHTGDSLLASASPSADAALIPAAAGTPAPARAFPPPFTTTSDYVQVAAYAKGGHNYLVNLFGYKVFWRVRNHFIYLKHQPKYVIIRVQGALPTVTLAGAATSLPAADVTKPVYTVVLAHDAGSLRLPPILIGFGALLIFGLTCERLHARDKAIQRRKATDAAAPPGGAPSRPAGELQPA